MGRGVRELWRSPWVKAAGWGLGLALVAAAVWFALRGVDASVLKGVGWRRPAWMGLLVVGNLLVAGVLFWSVTRVFPVRRPVGLGVMMALIAASGLLNYLPAVRAGLVGRAAYLKHKHGLAWKHSGLTLLIVMGVTLFVFAAVVLPLLVGRAYGVSDAWVWAGVGGSLVVGALACWGGTALMASGIDARGVVYPRGYPHKGLVWVPLRALDLGAGAGRLWLAFAALGSPIGYGDALVMSAAALFIRLIGLTPNGLGLSEWSVAALSAVLTPVEAGVAAAAALLDRAVEVVVVMATGLLALGRLGGGMRGTGSETIEA